MIAQLLNKILQPEQTTTVLLEIMVGQGQLLSLNVRQGNTCPRMAFADTGVGFDGFGHLLRTACYPPGGISPKQASAQQTMADIRLLAMAVDAGSIGKEDAEVVEHGSLFYEVCVGTQFGMPAHNVKSPVGNVAAMTPQQLSQLVVFRIIFLDDGFNMNHLGYHRFIQVDTIRR